MTLREDFHRGLGSPLVVDRESGIIHGVKILGWESDNKRRYEPTAAKAALHLYEGSKCYADHPDKPNKMRASRDALGIWRDVVWADEGVYADLHYLKTHPLAESICEDAERGLGVFGASHNADGEVHREGNVDVIKRITEVRSVDLVTDPATVSNLWEGKTVPETKAKPRAGQVRLVEMYEEDLMDPDAGPAPVGPEVGAGDHCDDLFAAFKKLRNEDPDKANKVLAMIKAEVGSSDDTALEADEDEDGKDDDDQPKTEGKKGHKPAAGSTTLTEAKAKKFCMLAGVEPTKELLEAVVGSDEDKALSVLHLVKGKAAGTGKPGASAPRSGGPRNVPVVEGKAPKTAEEQAKSLLC